MKNVVEEVIRAYGGIKAVQARFGYKRPMAVYNWRSRGIPKSLVAEIHLDTKIDILRLRDGDGCQPSPASRLCHSGI